MTRGKTIQYAVVTAILSKASSSFLQIFSLPLAAKVLGKEAFGVYSIVSLLMFILSMMQLGVGPALSRMIAAAHARKRLEEERHAFLSGVVLSLVIALAGGMLMSLVVSHFSIATLFGEQFAPHEGILKQSLLLAILLFGVEIVMWNVDRTQDGYLEAYINHTVLSVGNLAGAVILFLGIHHYRSIEFLLLAMSIPRIGFRFLSLAILLKRHPHLVKGWTRFRKETFRALIMDGVSFSATCNLVYLIEVLCCGLLVGRFLGPQSMAVYQVFAMIGTIFSNMVQMVARPYWTAVVNAMHQGDHRWVRQATAKLYVYFGILAGGAAIALTLLGPWIVEILYGPEFRLPRILFVAHCCFFALAGWRDICLYVMIGLGRLRQAVRPIVAGLLLSLSLGIAGLHHYELKGMYFGLASGILLVPAWKLALSIARSFGSDLRQDPVADSAPAVAISS